MASFEGFDSPHIAQPEQIEQAARDLHKKLWRSRAQSRQAVSSSVDKILETLEPAAAIHLLGMKVDTVDSLGLDMVGGTHCEVAGLLDRGTKRVMLSRQFSLPSQRFTLGHEAAHIVLDVSQRILHRDIPLERRKVEKDWREWRANRFASAYLMPRNLFINEFEARFKRDSISLTEEMSYALFGTGLDRVGKKIKDLRALSLAVARNFSFNGRTFSSLREQFKVSDLALAIRLEELELVTWPA